MSDENKESDKVEGDTIEGDKVEGDKVESGGDESSSDDSEDGSPTAARAERQEDQAREVADSLEEKG